MPEPLPRQVIREHSFEKAIAAIIEDEREADDFVDGAEFILSRDPKSGFLLYPNGSVWFLPMCPVGGKQVTLFYTFNDEKVWLFGIRAVAG